jgi:hypothetical protein
MHLSIPRPAVLLAIAQVTCEPGRMPTAGAISSRDLDTGFGIRHCVNARRPPPRGRREGTSQGQKASGNCSEQAQKCSASEHRAYAPAGTWLEFTPD